MHYGENKKEYTKLKWQLVTSHTVRHSFITQAIKRDMPESMIMKITGIKIQETLQKNYNRISLDKNAEMAAEFEMYKPKGQD